MNEEMTHISYTIRIVALLLASTAFSPAYAGGEEGQRSCCRDGEHPRWYAAIRGSAVFLSDTEYQTAPVMPVTGADRQSHDPGYGFSAAVGYQIFSGIRSEIELSYRNSAVKRDYALIVNTVPAGSTVGQRSFDAMFNTYLDLHNSSSYTPYIGAGIGESHVFAPRLYTVGGVESGKVADWAMAYDFMTGISYDFKVDHKPASIDVGYRYITTSDVTKTLPSGGGKVTISNDSHNFEVGGRVYF